MIMATTMMSGGSDSSSDPLQDGSDADSEPKLEEQPAQPQEGNSAEEHVPGDNQDAGAADPKEESDEETPLLVSGMELSLIHI